MYCPVILHELTIICYNVINDIVQSAGQSSALIVLFWMNIFQWVPCLKEYEFLRMMSVARGATRLIPFRGIGASPFR